MLDSIGCIVSSELKTWLRTAQACPRETLKVVVQTATEWITELNAKNWFDHCGYYVHYPKNRSKSVRLNKITSDA